MIKLYYIKHSKASKDAIEWFKQQNLDINIQNINSISEGDIFQSLYLSDIDVPYILRRGLAFFFLYAEEKKAKELRFSESLAYLEKKPYLLRDPIIISSDSSLIGYNEAKLKKLLKV